MGCSCTIPAVLLAAHAIVCALLCSLFSRDDSYADPVTIKPCSSKAAGVVEPASTEEDGFQASSHALVAASAVLVKGPRPGQKCFDKKLSKEYLQKTNKVFAREGTIRIRVVRVRVMSSLGRRVLHLSLTCR